MKQYLKPCAHEQSEHPSGCDGVPFVELASESLARGEVNRKGAEAKASLNRAT